MKKFVSMLCALLLLVCMGIPASAAEGEPTITFEEHLGTRICVYTLPDGGEMRFAECTEEDERFVLGWYLYESENLQGHVVVPDYVAGEPVVGLYFANQPSTEGTHVYCLSQNPELVSVTFPATLKRVIIQEDFMECGTLYGCDKLEEIIFTGEGPEEIPTYFFRGAKNLKHVKIPKNVADMDGAFHARTYGAGETSDLMSLTNLEIDPENKNFVMDEQGILYNADMTKVVTAIQGAAERESVTLPESVTEIASFAFSGNTRLEKVFGGADNMKFGKDIFDSCKALNPFRDSYGHWAEESVKWAYQEGVLKGVTELRFSVDTTLERGMFCTALYRMSGDRRTGEASFSDVPQYAYYTDAVAWAEKNGIVQGYADGTFRPMTHVTREQMAAFLYRYAQEMGIEGSAAELSDFKDAGSVSSYAKDAMEWAVGTGLLKGKNGNRLDPQGQATRAEAAAILQRFGEYTNQ